MSKRVFISAATDEFGQPHSDIRERIANAIWGVQYEAICQEIFAKPGGYPTLKTLREKILSCGLCIHLIGNKGDTAADNEDYQEFCREYPEEIEKIKELIFPEGKYHQQDREALMKGLSYTQWEAYLSKYHQKMIILLRPSWLGDRGKSKKQSDHEQRMLGFGKSCMAAPISKRELHDKIGNLVSGHLNPPISANNASSRAAQSTKPKALIKTDIQLPRSSYVKSIRDLLTQVGTTKKKPSKAVALWGNPGYGKSTLLSLIWKDQVIRKYYKDGKRMFFTSCGRDFKPEEAIYTLERWAESLGIDKDKRKANSDIGELIAEAVADTPALFVIDDVWNAQDGAMFKFNNENCHYLFTSREGTIARHLVSPPSNVNAIQVKRITQIQSEYLVREMAPHCFEISGEIRRGIVGIIKKYSGHIMAINVIGRLLKEHPQDEEIIESVIKQLRLSQHISSKQQTDEESSLNQLIETSYNTLGADLQLSIRRLAVLRPDPHSFSNSLAKHITGCSEQFVKLREKMLFIERVGKKRDYGKGLEDFFNIHMVFSEWLAGKLSPNEIKDVYKSAAEYFEITIREEESRAREQSDYDRWYCYEDPVWHEAMFNWKYYLVKAGDQYTLATLSFILTKVWLGGFWWWDTFSEEKSTFCSKWLDDWPLDAAETPLLKEDLRDLNILFDNYPREADSERATATRKEKWLNVRAALQSLKSRQKLTDEDAATLNNDQTDFRGLINILLAETYRFGEQKYSEALKLYRDAVTDFGIEFVDDKECWNLAWAQYHLADCLRECGMIDEAKSICFETMQKELNNKKNGDQEVVARFYLILAALAVKEFAIDAALEYLHGAIFYAYRFQIYAEIDPTQKPHGPDDYTLKHYSDIALEAMEEIVGLAGSEPTTSISTAVQMANELYKRWGNDAIAAGGIELVINDASTTEHDKALALQLAILPAPIAQAQWKTLARAPEVFIEQVEKMLSTLPKPKRLENFAGTT